MASSHLLHSPLPNSITFVYIPHPPCNLWECELEPGKLWPRVWAFRCEGQRKNRRLIIPSILKRARFCSLKMNIRNGWSGDVKTARERRAWILNAIFMGHCTSCFPLLILKLSQASASSPHFTLCTPKRIASIFSSLSGIPTPIKAIKYRAIPSHHVVRFFWLWILHQSWSGN